MFSVVTKYHKGGIPYFYTIQKSFMHLHKIFYALPFSLNQTSCEMKIQNLPVRFQSYFKVLVILLVEDFMAFS